MTPLAAKRRTIQIVTDAFACGDVQRASSVFAEDAWIAVLGRNGWSVSNRTDFDAAMAKVVRARIRMRATRVIVARDVMLRENVRVRDGGVIGDVVANLRTFRRDGRVIREVLYPHRAERAPFACMFLPGRTRALPATPAMPPDGEPPWIVSEDTASERRQEEQVRRWYQAWSNGYVTIATEMLADDGGSRLHEVMHVFPNVVIEVIDVWSARAFVVAEWVMRSDDGSASPPVVRSSVHGLDVLEVRPDGRLHLQASYGSREQWAVATGAMRVAEDTDLPRR